MQGDRENGCSPAPEDGGAGAADAEARLRAVARACVLCARLLMQHGAESALVEDVARRLGLALGADGVEIAVMANAIVVTTLSGGRCITTVRRVADRGINMTVVMEAQQVMHEAERGGMSPAEAETRLAALRPRHYPRALVVAVIGLSCAAFARLAGAPWEACGVVAAAGALAMAARQQLALWHFNPFVNFAATAFAATTAAWWLGARTWPDAETQKIILASSVLLLVPGMPLINSLSDMVKGYVNTGLARLGFAALLLFATCLGIALAVSVWRAHGWF